MGCSSSRVDKPCHEAALIAGENSLMYSLHEISTLFPLIKAISKDGRIRKGDFKTFLKNNKLAGDEKSFEFYKRITVDKGFELTMVATLAAILCKGSNEQKISALIEAWTAQDLNKERASEIFDCIFDLAVEFLPILVAPPTIENNYTPDELNHFLQRAKSGRERAKFDILKEIFSSDTVNKKDLIDWFNKNTNSTWLVSHTVRENLKEIGKKARKEKKHKSTQDAVLTDNKSSGMLGKTSQSLDVHASHEINSVPISEVIEKHHYNHHHHEHHEGIVDASE
jgi:hypothetical protein